MPTSPERPTKPEPDIEALLLEDGVDVDKQKIHAGVRYALRFTLKKPWPGEGKHRYHWSIISDDGEIGSTHPSVDLSKSDEGPLGYARMDLGPADPIPDLSVTFREVPKAVISVLVLITSRVHDSIWRQFQLHIPLNSDEKHLSHYTRHP
jgi:hypothetical protein